MLTVGWELVGTAPGAVVDPGGLPTAGWLPAVVPGTVAQALGVGVASTVDLAASDWWYRVRFPGEEGEFFLHFEALATIAEGWLNGEPLLRSRSSFVPCSVNVADRLRPENELVLVFRSLTAELAQRRPRPRWKTALVEQQNLRWLRTPLVGHIPGWSPRLAPIGPWRGVRLERIGAFHLDEIDLVARLEGSTGVVALAGRVLGALQSATLRVGEAEAAVTVGAGGTVHAELRLPDVRPWWPHTHGNPTLLAATLTLGGGGVVERVDLGKLGFKSVEVNSIERRVQLVVNGRPIFARGACWTVDDPASLDGDERVTAETLRRAKQAGMNLIRIGGTMTYPSDTLLNLCDELGLLVWQDFMFANMDYPFADAAFRAEVDQEVHAQLRRFQRHPCIAVYCGGSEVEQQAAMVGLPPSEGRGPFYTEALPARCAALHPGIPYFSGTPTGGAMPFSTGSGITHYYGVGAYRRPLSDARRAAVKFSPECLGFSNVPEPESMEAMLGGALPPPHHPVWKAGVPRDGGAGWDFEDVRDHYLREAFGVDPVGLRSTDLERYYALSRVVPGELLTRVYAEWRRPESGCGGALVWFLKDLRPGAGWGLLDDANRPKSVWWFLRRVWAPVAVLLTDEGLDGLGVHVVNEAPEPLRAEVEVELFRAGRTSTSCARASVEVPAFGGLSLSADAILGHFTDIVYAYRFGPPRHDVVVVRLLCDGVVRHQDVFFPLGQALPRVDAPGWRATAVLVGDGQVELTVEAPVFLQALAISSPGWEPDDNYAHVPPGRPRCFRFTPNAEARAFKAHLTALNVEGLLTVRVSPPA